MDNVSRYRLNQDVYDLMRLVLMVVDGGGEVKRWWSSLGLR